MVSRFFLAGGVLGRWYPGGSFTSNVGAIRPPVDIRRVVDFAVGCLAGSAGDASAGQSLAGLLYKSAVADRGGSNCDPRSSGVSLGH